MGSTIIDLAHGASINLIVGVCALQAEALTARLLLLEKPAGLQSATRGSSAH
jgi:hypothetical protein